MANGTAVIYTPCRLLLNHHSQHCQVISSNPRQAVTLLAWNFLSAEMIMFSMEGNESTKGKHVLHSATSHWSPESEVLSLVFLLAPAHHVLSLITCVLTWQEGETLTITVFSLPPPELGFLLYTIQRLCEEIISFAIYPWKWPPRDNKLLILMNSWTWAQDR